MAGVSIVERYLKSLKEEKTLLFITISLAMIFYFMTLSLNSTYDDNLSYLNIGKELSETGNYTGNFWNRPPVIPFTVSVLYSLGLGLITITIFLPLAFLILFLLANFFLFRTLYNRGLAFLVTWAIMALPSFWRWSERVGTDTPLGVFAIFSLLFFYLGIEKDRKYLIITSVFFALSFLTKIIGVALIPVFILYMIYRRRWNVLATREFGLGLLIGTAIPAIVILSIFLSDPTIFSTDSIYFATVPQGQALMLKFFLNPLFVFVPLGMLRVFKNRRKEHVLVLLSILFFLVIISRMVMLMRYVTVIYGLIFFLSIYGLMLVKRRDVGKYIFGAIFIAGILIGLVNSVYLMGIDSEMRYGVRDVASFTEESIATGERIAAGNIAGYLTTYTSRYVVSFPYYVDVVNVTTSIDKFNSIVTNSNHELYEKYVALARMEDPKYYYYFYDGWVEENNITYIVWSIYDEFLLEPEESYYNIRYAGVELPVKRIYNSLRPPSGYGFSSNVYNHLETDNKYEKVKEFHKEGNKIIIIYKYNGH